MTQSSPIAALLADWGTSHLRVWTVAPDGRVIGERQSGQGMGLIEPSDYAGILAAHAGSLGADPDVPALICGMAGSRQGWHEAAYLDLPCDLSTLPGAAVRVTGETRDIRILPGVARRDPARPDVMRSEETQLLGYWRLAGNRIPDLVCMPGTHAKWAEMTQGGRVLSDFATAMTGDLFAAVSGHTVLRHSLAGSGKAEMRDAFLAAARQSLDEPATFLSRLFSVRPRGLLFGSSPDTARATVSGAVIGQDVAGALARFGRPKRIGLVGGGSLGPLYADVMEMAGISVEETDGDSLAIAGLAAAAAVIWPGRFDDTLRIAS